MVTLTGIRTALLESAEHQCPSCETPGQSPDVLIPNKYLRAMVTSYINETSYVSTSKLPVSSSATSSAGTAVVKTETVVADVAHRTSNLSTPVIPASTHVKLEQMPVQPPLLSVPFRTGTVASAGDQFSYQMSRSSVRHVTANQTPPTLLELPDVKYSQPLALAESGGGVVQSQSAPNILSRSKSQ